MALTSGHLIEEFKDAINKNANKEDLLGKLQALSVILSTHESKIPGLHEFDQLLTEIVPLPAQYESDLKLLGLSNLSISYDKTYGFPIVSQRAHPKSNDPISNNMNPSNCLSMTKFDKFNCLVIGCRALLTNIDFNTNRNFITNENLNDNLNVFLENVDAYGDFLSIDNTNENLLKEQIGQFWDLLEEILDVEQIDIIYSMNPPASSTITITNEEDEMKREYEIPTAVTSPGADTSSLDDTTVVTTRAQATRRQLAESKQNEHKQDETDEPGNENVFEPGAGGFEGDDDMDMDHNRVDDRGIGILRLAMLLFANENDFDQLSFVKQFLSYYSGPGGEGMIENVNKLKKQINDTLGFGILKIGTFMDVYHSISNDKGSNSYDTARKFLVYYEEFENEVVSDMINKNNGISKQAIEFDHGDNSSEHFLLRNREPFSGKTIMNLAKEAGNVQLTKLLSKYSKSAAAIMDDFLMKHSTYIYETHRKIKNELTTV